MGSTRTPRPRWCWWHPRLLGRCHASSRCRAHVAMMMMMLMEATTARARVIAMVIAHSAVARPTTRPHTTSLSHKQQGEHRPHRTLAPQTHARPYDHSSHRSTHRGGAQGRPPARQGDSANRGVLSLVRDPSSRQTKKNVDIKSSIVMVTHHRVASFTPPPAGRAPARARDAAHGVRPPDVAEQLERRAPRGL